MPIIDFHSHIIRDRETKEYCTEALLRDMGDNAIDIRMIAAMEGKSISHQNFFVSHLAAEHPQMLIPCAAINPKEDNGVEEMLRVAEEGNFKAIELDSLEHGYLPETCDALDEIFDICHEAGLVVCAFTGWGPRTAPMQWAYYAKRHPKVPLVLLHMGGYDFGYNCIEVAKKFPNIYVETSDVYELPIMHIALREIPHEKILFGSQYPEKITACSKDFFDMFDLSDEDRELFFWKNAARLLKIEGLNGI
ncbi:MAG: amidohydrolase [Synergistaceae bacterium]|jgi:predicted TIM-barrel fold metal-dependent hydrolase|nr:amidohydrolase [Synergistaceae bacterium]